MALKLSICTHPRREKKNDDQIDLVDVMANRWHICEHKQRYEIIKL